MKPLSLSIVFCCSLICVNTNAAQMVRMKDGESTTVFVSEKDLTRIAVKGLRIKDVWASNATIESNVDADNGDLFIKPVGTMPFSFFVRDENGQTYTLIATIKDVPSETIVIQPLGKSLSIPANSEDGQDKRKRLIRDLMKSMATNTDNGEYSISKVEREIPLWAEVRVIAAKEYDAGQFIGTSYVVKNITKQEMTLYEDEFLSFGSGVVAVTLLQNIVKPNDSVYLFVIRKNKDQQ